MAPKRVVPYRTCVSVGETTPALMRRALARALARSEYAEARLDYLSMSGAFELLDSLPADALRRRIICTLRARYDGGRFRGSEDARTGMLRRIALEYRPWLLDVELATLRRNRRLEPELRECGARILASWHDFEKMPTAGAMRKRLEEMSRHATRLKIACMAETVSESARMLEMYGWLSEHNAGRAKRDKATLVSFAMGDAGRMTRILCMHAGSPYTYVSLGSPIAPGQFSLTEVRALGGANHRTS